MAAPDSNIGELYSAAIADGVTQALISSGLSMSFPSGTAPLIGQTEEASFGGSLVQGQYDAVGVILEDGEHSPKALTNWLEKALTFAGNTADTVVRGIAWGTKELVEIPFNYLANEGPATPDKALGNMATAFGLTTSAGLIASVLSDIPSISVLGCVDLNFRSLSAFLAKMGGWDSIFGQVWAPLMRGYVGQPMRYYINKQLTPFLPGLMDLERLRYKRILPGSMNPATAPPGVVGQGYSGKMPGYDYFAEQVAYAGFSPEWAEIFENDLYTEPRHFELGIMGENPAIPDSWWWEKCRRMGYTEMDVGYMVGGIKNKIAGGYVQAKVNEVITNYREGIVGDETLAQVVQESGISDMAQVAAIDTAQWKKHREVIAEETKVLLAQFNRDSITLDELRNRLDLYYEDPKAVDRLVSMAEISRYRRVYWTTEIEQARAALQTYRVLFVAGRITEAEYQAWLIDAGLEPVAFDAMADLDYFRRDKAIAGDFQRYGLPKLRDLFLHGMIDRAQYSRELVDGGFPDEYIDLELDLVEVKARERQSGIVRRDELAIYESAYVVGLVSRSTVKNVMEAAGLDDYGIEAHLLQLDYEWDQFKAKREAAIAKADDLAKAKAKAEADKRAREFEQARAKARGVTEEWSRLKVAEAKESLAQLASTLIGEVKLGADADGGKLKSLTASLVDALWWANVSAA